MYSLSTDPLNCLEYCGDGIRVSATVECDDGNFDDGDGCSSTCTIESGWSCSGGDSSNPDVCYKDNIEYTLTIVND